jgi:hypothetical protein
MRILGVLWINDLPPIGTTINYSLENRDTYMTKTIAFTIKNKSGHVVTYVNNLGSGNVNLTNNSNDFISGTFNCTLYQDTTWLTPYDTTMPASVLLTDGYFDVANK